MLGGTKRPSQGCRVADVLGSDVVHHVHGPQGTVARSAGGRALPTKVVATASDVWRRRVRFCAVCCFALTRSVPWPEEVLEVTISDGNEGGNPNKSSKNERFFTS